MKTSYYLLFVCSLLICSSCSLSNVPVPDDTTKLVCIGTYTLNSVTRDSVFFTEDKIKGFDTITNQLQLKDSIKQTDLATFRNFKFYLGTDSLFAARPAFDIMSAIINDLVIHFNYRDGKVYLENGYPA